MFHNFVKKLNTPYVIVNSIAEKFVGIIVILMFLSLIIQVISRYVFHSPLSWPEEFTMFLMGWMSFIGAGVALRHWQHIGIDFFTQKLVGRPHRILMLTIRLIVLAFSCILFVEGVKFVISSQDIVSEGMRISMVWPRLSLPLGSALLIFNAFIMSIIDIDMLLHDNTENNEDLQHGK